jgi:hypothetical protein
MYRCSGDGLVSGLFTGAGLQDVAEWDVPIEMVTGSPAKYWEIISDHVSLVAAALQQVDAAGRERMAALAMAQVSEFERDGQVRVPGLARCVVGTRPPL